MKLCPSPVARLAARRRGASLAGSVAATAVVLVIAGVAAFIAMNRISAGRRDAELKHGELLGTMTGLGRPIQNKLAAGYLDANNDRVADAPADVARHRDPAEIVFSYVASEENAAAAAQATFKPLTDAIAAATGKPVRYLPVADADLELNAMHDGTLHVAAFNTGSVPTAVDVAGFVPVALLGGDSGPSSYQLKIIASTRTNITDVNGLRGHELALTEISSNSGYKAPLVLLQKKFGLRPGFDFGIRYSYGHAQSIGGLVDGTYEAVAVASDVLARAEQTGAIKPDQYRVLYTSEAFPTACFGYAHDLKPELAAKVRKALTDFRFDAGTAGNYFAAAGQTRLVPLDYAKDFALVRDVDDAIGYEHVLRPAATTTQEEEATTQQATQPSTQPSRQ